MILLPKGFVETCCAGYFWNIKRKQLYSLKKAGTLTALKHVSGNSWNNGEGGYYVSHQGRKYKLNDSYLAKLTEGTEEFPVHHRYYK